MTFPWELADEIGPEFNRKVRPLDADFPIRPRGIWTSELFAFCVWAQRFGVKSIVESGVWKGQSTMVLDRFFPATVPFYGIDLDGWNPWVERLCPQRVWTRTTGNAHAVLRKVLDDGTMPRPAALLIDGPKGAPAVQLAAEALRMGHVAFVAIHDCYRPVPPRVNEAREAAEISGWPFWATDDRRFVADYGYLDAARHREWLDEEGFGKLPYRYLGRSESFPMLSYGPTLLFAFRSATP